MEYIKIGLPMFIAVLGWIVVHNLNKKNMEEEKKLVLKSEAYKELKEKDKKLNHSYAKFIAFLDYTSNQLKYYNGNVDISEINENNPIKLSEAEKFNNLMCKCIDNFVEYTSTWEINKIIFKELEKESYALQEEHKTLGKLRTKIFSEYLDFIKNNQDKNKVDIKKLRGRIKLLVKESVNFISCINDVNYDLQNLVYGDLFEGKIEKRKVSNKNDVTIDDLLEKHKKEIENNYIS
jgi:hypothetical protein